MPHHIVHSQLLPAPPAAQPITLPEPQGIWKSYKLTNKNLDFTFIPNPCFPDCPTSVSLSLRPAYAVVTLYCPEMEDIPPQYQRFPSLLGKEPEHEDILHRNKGSADEHYHFKFEQGDTEKIEEFISHALNNYLLITASEKESFRNFLTAFDTFMKQDQDFISFDNLDTAQKNIKPDMTTSY